MRYARLGRSGLKVSRLCLGTGNFGWVSDEATAHDMMDRALDSGVNFFDSADVYGEPFGTGVSESIIGRWFAKGGSRREKVVMATKLGVPMGDRPNESGFSALHIKLACEASLERLGTDYIDLYQMHRSPYPSSTWEEVWQAMEQLVREGKVLYVGGSNLAAWHVSKGNDVAHGRNFMGLVSEQCQYHLNARLVEVELLPACEDYGLGVLPWSPLGGGLLGGVLRKMKEGQGLSARAQAMARQVEANRDKLEQYESLCSEIGEDPASVALAWLLSRPVVTAPVIGPRTMEQFEENLRAVDVELSPETLARLDSIWPVPGYEQRAGDQAPAAYMP